MRVGFFQFQIAFADRRSNLDRVASALSANASAFHLLVLPELFTTGYLLGSRAQARTLAESVPDGRTTKALIEIARRHDGYLVGGIVERDHNRVYNTAVVVGPDGFIGKHRKLHLTRLEIPLFDRGRDLEVFNLRGVRIGVLLCFDTWIPEAARGLAMKGAQIICICANFGGPQTLDIAKVRSLENKVYTITANRIGNESRNGIEATFCGESQIVDDCGGVLYRADGREALQIVEIDPDSANQKANLLCDELFAELKYQHL